MTDRRPAVVALLIASLALAGCAELFEFPAPSPAASGSPSPSPTAEDAPPEAPAPVPGSASGAVIPTDCRTLVSLEVYEATFGDVPLNDPGYTDAGKVGVLRPTEPPEGATVQEIIESQTRLGCLWRDPAADITYLWASVAIVDPLIGGQFMREREAEGFTCWQMHGGERCQLIQPNEVYPVDEGFTHFLRDDVYVYVGQANIVTNDLLGDVVAQLWGDAAG